MPEAIVQIEDVESRVVNTKYGQKTVWNVKGSDGRRYGTWDAELGQLAGRLRGQAVTIEYRERQAGEYTNYDLKALEANEDARDLVEQSRPQTTGNSYGYPRQAPVAPQEPSSKNEEIARAVALKAAVELAAGGVIEDPTPDGLLTVSNVFTDWLLTGGDGRLTGDGPKAEVIPIVDRDPADETDDLSMVKF